MLCKGRITAGQDSTDKRLDEITVAMHARRAVQLNHKCYLPKEQVSEGNVKLYGSLQRNQNTKEYARVRAAGVAGRSVLRFRLQEGER